MNQVAGRTAAGLNFFLWILKGCWSLSSGNSSHTCLRMQDSPHKSAQLVHSTFAPQRSSITDSRHVIAHYLNQNGASSESPPPRASTRLP